MSQPTDLTPFAQKYTHPTSPSHAILANSRPLKSGLTPLPNRSILYGDDRKKLEKYQRRRFQGFTIEELVFAESLAPVITETALYTLYGVGIHPLYRRGNWQAKRLAHLPKFPMRKGRPGYWEVEEMGKPSPIWDALLPALKMASLFIANAHIWPWWDGLLEGEWTRIADWNLPAEFRNKPKQKYAKFSTRLPTRVWNAKDLVQDRFLAAADHVEFYLISGYTNSRSGLPGDYFSAETDGRSNSAKNKAVVTLSYELIEPLLRTDLTPAERSLDTHGLATTIIHETCVSDWLENSGKPQAHHGPDGNTRKNTLLNGTVFPERVFVRSWTFF